MSVQVRSEPLIIERRFYLYRSQVEERQWVCWCRNWFWIGTDQYQAVPAPRAMVTPPLSIIIVNQPLTSRKLRISPRMQSKNICLSLFTHWAAPGPGWAKLPLAILQREITFKEQVAALHCYSESKSSNWIRLDCWTCRTFLYNLGRLCGC